VSGDIDRDTADMAIVGAGPVGQVLAILLARRGWHVVIVDRFAEPYALPRAAHFDHEVARILQSCGIGDGIAAITEPASRYEWRNGDGVTLLRLGGDGHSDSAWPGALMFHQPSLEALLLDRIDGIPSIDLRRGVEIVDLVHDADHVSLTTATGHTIDARWVIGCDGANSTVRRLIAAHEHDLGYFFDWLIVDVILHEPRVFDPINLQVCDPARPTTAVSGGPGRRRWEFMRLPDESIDDLTADGRVWELLAPWDVHPGNATVERSTVYTFNARHVEGWRSGRVLLAGDAAHLMPPFAGQGMCSGIRDAANLAWKLDLVAAGHAPESLLDLYEHERLPGVRAMIDLSVELGRVICVPDPAAAAERDAAMAPLVRDEPIGMSSPPGPTVGIIDPSAPLAGRLAPQSWVGDRRFDDVHGLGWRMLTVDDPTDIDDVVDRAALDAFIAIGGSAHGVGDDTADTDGTARRWFERHGVRWALQRPDAVLYGAAVDPAGAASLLDRLRDDLADPTRTLTAQGAHP
jgi:flavoprotein hydroxylase